MAFAFHVHDCMAIKCSKFIAIINIINSNQKLTYIYTCINRLLLCGFLLDVRSFPFKGINLE